MAVIAVLGGLCALAVVILASVVSRLSGQVRALSAELAAVAERAEPTPTSTPLAPIPAAAPIPAVAPMPVDDVAHTAAAPAVAAAVPVITALPSADDDLDITARRVASVTFARPLIKVASLAYGLRRALDDEHRFKVRHAMRQELRRQRKMRRRRRAGRAPSMGWRS